VTLYRCFAWEEGAEAAGPDGPLWFPRAFQGDGRHDNPDLYGCLYLSGHAISTVVEQLARFRGQALIPSLLRRRGLPLALAELDLAADAELADLDDPSVLRRERLRPSRVATRRRDITQPQARVLYEARRGLAGLRWWSAIEALWINVTLFERAGDRLHVAGVRPLSVDHPIVAQAAAFLGLRTRT
jgi:hypothetical protein